MINVTPIDAGLRLFDEIEGVQCDLWTDDPVTPRSLPVADSRVSYPLDHAIAIETEELTVPQLTTIHVRDDDGEYARTYNPDDGPLRIAPGQQVDIPAAMKLYLVVGSRGTLDTDGATTVLRFEEPTEVEIGVRSFHESPADSITCPPEPEPLMEALSAFGSALKTTSCERSFPSHRGHPPTLEFGDDLEIPEGIEPPETGVRLEVPPALEYVYPAAPLSFYLGAELVPAGEPALVYGDRRFALDRAPGYQQTVARVLRTVHLLDCVVRTVGLFELTLDVESRLRDAGVDLDKVDLYGRSIPEQLDAYLGPPGRLDAVEPLLPEWPVCVDVVPDVEHARALPYLLDELALVRTFDHDRETSAYDPEMQDTIRGFLRTGGDGSSASDIFVPPDAPAVSQAYLGPGLPLQADKASVDVLERRLDRTPADERISVSIVCNDPQMEAESVVEEYYGLRDLIQFDVEVFHALDRADLADLLERDRDFVHFIGHIDDQGLRCPDGPLDAHGVPAVGSAAVLLNGCTSYEQGQALVDAGCLASVVTVSEIANGIATQVGRTLARSLNSGFPLRGALDVAGRHYPTRQRYAVIGDGKLQLVQAQTDNPYYLDVRAADAEQFDVDLYVYPAPGYGPGTVVHPHMGEPSHCLPFGKVNTFRAGLDELESTLERIMLPVSLNGHLYWSDELTEKELLAVLNDSLGSRPHGTASGGRRSGLAQQ